MEVHHKIARDKFSQTFVFLRNMLDNLSIVALAYKAEVTTDARSVSANNSSETCARRTHYLLVC